MILTVTTDRPVDTTDHQRNCLVATTALAGKIERWPIWPGQASRQKRTAGPGPAGLAKQKELTQTICSR